MTAVQVHSHITRLITCIVMQIFSLLQVVEEGSTSKASQRQGEGLGT